MRSIGSALRGAIAQRNTVEATLDPVAPEARIDGKVCLITGANSGPGKAVAIDLARRGGEVLMACRSGLPEAGEEVRRASGSDRVWIHKVELDDLASVHALCDTLRAERRAIDIAVLNAGLVPRRASRSKQGFELMFAVHFLANRVLVDRLLEDGLLQTNRASENRASGDVPRIVFVSSEAHRPADPIDFEQLGAFTPYPFRDSVKVYGQSKFVQCTYACELSRRLNPDGKVAVAVHTLCPGPVNTGIARATPWVLKPLMGPLMKAFFASPEAAAAPVVYLCCAPDAGTRTGLYLHKLREKLPAPAALEPENGARLWAASEKRLRAQAAS